jgi:hypothetical protein
VVWIKAADNVHAATAPHNLTALTDSPNARPNFHDNLESFLTFGQARLIPHQQMTVNALNQVDRH